MPIKELFQALLISGQFTTPIGFETLVEKKSEKYVKKTVKICFFFTTNFVHNFAANAVNAVKLCRFTARVSGELTKIHHNSPLTTSYRPCTDFNLSPPACQPLFFHCAAKNLASLF